MAYCSLIGCWSYKRCNTCSLSKKGNEEGRRKYSWWGNSEDCENETGVREAGEVEEKAEEKPVVDSDQSGGTEGADQSGNTEEAPKEKSKKVINNTMTDEEKKVTDAEADEVKAEVKEEVKEEAPKEEPKEEVKEDETEEPKEAPVADTEPAESVEEKKEEEK